jgi:hypothetical protein
MMAALVAGLGSYSVQDVNCRLRYDSLRAKFSGNTVDRPGKPAETTPFSVATQAVNNLTLDKPATQRRHAYGVLLCSPPLLGKPRQELTEDFSGPAAILYFRDSLDVLHRLIAHLDPQNLSSVKQQTLRAKHEQPRTCEMTHFFSEFRSWSPLFAVFLAPPVLLNISSYDQDIQVSLLGLAQSLDPDQVIAGPSSVLVTWWPFLFCPPLSLFKRFLVLCLVQSFSDTTVQYWHKPSEYGILACIRRKLAGIIVSQFTNSIDYLTKSLRQHVSQLVTPTNAGFNRLPRARLAQSRPPRPGRASRGGLRDRHSPTPDRATAQQGAGSYEEDRSRPGVSPGPAIGRRIDSRHEDAHHVPDQKVRAAGTGSSRRRCRR